MYWRKIMLFVWAFGCQCLVGYAQKSKINTADSVQFVQITQQFNDIINTSPAKATAIAESYFAKAQQLQNADYMGRGATLMSTALMAENKINDGLQWYNKAQQYFIKAQNYTWKGYGGLNMGIMLSRQYDFERGLPYLLKSVDDFEQAKDYDMLVSAYCTISNTFHDSKNYEKGKDYAFRALKVIKEHPSVKAHYIWRAYTVLGINYDDNKEYEKAIENHLKALPYAQTYIESTYNNLGNTYKKLGQIDKAQQYFNKCLDALKINPPKYSVAYNWATIYGNLVDVNRLKKDYVQANKYLDSALLYAQKSESPEKILDAYEYAYLLKNATNEPKQSLQFLEKYVKLKDSLLNEENTKTILNIQGKYETEKKEKQIAVLSRDNRIKALDLFNQQLALDKNQSLILQQNQQLTINELELKNKNQIVANQKLDAKQKAQSIKTLEKQTKIQNLEIANRTLAVRQRNYAISAILVAFIAVGGLSFSYYNRQKLKQENRIQAEIHKQQEIATKAVFDGEQQERIRIARDLHDSIGQMLSVVKMNLSTTENTDNQTLQLVDKTIAEVRNISHNLIPEELNFGLFNAIEDMCDKINTGTKPYVKLHIAPDIREIKFSRQNELSIYRIVQEVLGNMLKHANATEITLDIEKNHKNIQLAIKDNGKGFDTEKINQSKGLGWKNISARVNLLDGEMKVASEKLVGTRIDILIPS